MMDAIEGFCDEVVKLGVEFLNFVEERRYCFSGVGRF